MEFEVLGPVHLLNAGRRPSLGRLQRTLLAVLLVHANRPVSPDVLVDALWGDGQGDRAEQNLRVHLHRLRRALGDTDRLPFESGAYRIVVMPGELDAQRFESLVDEAAEVGGQEPERGVELLRKALGLWRGRAYDGIDVPVVADDSERLADRRLAATEALYEVELSNGRNAELVSDLTDLVRHNPLRERLHALLMTALYRAGRQADALRAYQDARRTLVEELGLEPGPELRAIEQRVLAGEPVELGVPAVAVPTPAQLPVNVRGFVGREAEAAELNRLVTDGEDSMATLSGTAGVGKTALAVWWAHRVRDRFPDGQLYVDLRGFGPEIPVDSGDALDGFLRALGVDGSTIPLDLAERAARYRTLLDGRRMLVVLDNARTADQVRPLLPGTSTCVTVITSRHSLGGLGTREGARRIDLDRLSDDEAFRLMEESLGESATTDPVAVGALIATCARLPLALRVAADLVRSRPARGVADLVAELADERDRLDLLDVDEDPHSAVRVVFSWSYQQLSPMAARLFRMCGIHPGHDAEPYGVAALADVDVRTARRGMDALVRAHLVDETTDGHYLTHDLLRAYARELAEDTESAEDRDRAIARLSGFSLSVVSAAMDLIAPSESERRPSVAASTVDVPSIPAEDVARRWLDRERPNLLGVVPHASDVDTIALSDLLWRYLEMGGHADDAYWLHTRALAAAQRRGDARAEGNQRRYLGTVAFLMGDFDQAVEQDERAIACFRECGDVSAVATALNNLGSSEFRRSRYREALRHYEEAMRLHSELGEQPSAQILANAGNLHRTLGDYDRALAYLNQAREREVERGDRYGAGLASSFLAGTYSDLGRLNDALEYAHQALDFGRAAGVPLLEADALHHLGVTHRKLGDYTQALEYLTGSLEIARDGDYDASVAELLCDVAETHRLAGESAQALQELGEALDLAVATGDRFVEAGAHAGLGDVHADLDDLDQARQSWRQAMGIYRDLGLPEAEELRSKLDALD